MELYKPTTGYGLGGASRARRSLVSFQPNSRSPTEDIDKNNLTLRRRARLLYMNSPIGASIIKTMKTNVIGNGLRLKAHCTREVLGLTETEADLWNKNTEREFLLWAENKRACDVSGVNNFYGLQQLAFMSCIMSGDSFVIVKRKNATVRFPYMLRLAVLEADRVNTPTDKLQTQNVFDGVELDKDGTVLAYYISEKYPDNLDFFTAQNKWERIKAYDDELELPNVLQIMNTERPEQFRGVSVLATAIEPIRQLSMYVNSELDAALISSMFTVVVTDSPDNVTDDFSPLQETGDVNGTVPANNSIDSNFNIGSGIIAHLPAGKKIDIVESKRPATGFAPFTEEIIKHIGAATEIPAEIISKHFTASYSASRAAILEAWKSFKIWRSWFAEDFCKPVYEIWLSEAVSGGRIQADGFFENPLKRNAWLASEWIGFSQGQLDPLKEIKAEVMACENGFSTREQSANRLFDGTDFTSNAEKLKVENSLLRETLEKLGQSKDLEGENL
jgi:lambda family phage portal protein